MSWRRTGSGDLPIALLWLASAVMALACMPLFPLAARVLPPCALHTLTGIPCFACGSSRAVLAMARGDWLGALALNPLASLGIVAGCVGGFEFVWHGREWCSPGNTANSRKGYIHPVPHRRAGRWLWA